MVVMSERLKMEPGVWRGLKHGVGILTTVAMTVASLWKTDVHRPEGRLVLEREVEISTYAMPLLLGIQLIFSESSDCMMVSWFYLCQFVFLVGLQILKQHSADQPNKTPSQNKTVFLLKVVRGPQIQRGIILP